ncbi:hypothetical protein Enr13x_67630 [Stieleria neptunia]|uniref:Uncharacterized protein n=1 Tax=Stieleria neptunia TaxID=2527979 RepID=A0A518I1F1_9BACT|nr:hypothetical protein [Stieleria neptunia]QDV46854.1 hypothetical protein Enr13x_67630 [Stieleria neptunia]
MPRNRGKDLVLVCQECNTIQPDDDPPPLCINCDHHSFTVLYRYEAEASTNDADTSFVRREVPTGNDRKYKQFDLDSEPELYRQLKKRVTTTPPRCISNLRASITSVDVQSNGDTAIYSVSCPCGSDHGVVLGHYLRDFSDTEENCMLSPLAWRCVACQKRLEFLDTDLHGYHAANGFGPGRHAKGSGRRKQLRCPNCDGRRMKLFLGFSYWDFDIFLDAAELGYDDPSSLHLFDNPEDYFHEIITLASCSNCSELIRFTDFGKL